MKKMLALLFILGLFSAVGCQSFKDKLNVEPELPIKVVKVPTFSLPSGKQTEDVTLTISHSEADAIIYYTNDGSEPTKEKGTLYDGIGIAIKGDKTVKTIKAIAYVNNVASDVVSVIIEIDYDGVAMPTFKILSGTYTGNVTFKRDVELQITHGTAGAEIYYTDDGTAELTKDNGTKYTDSILIGGDETVKTIKAIAYVNDVPSDVVSVTITIDYDEVTMPIFLTLSGTYTEDVELQITHGTAGAEIYYTEDGTTELTKDNGTKYIDSILIGGDKTVKTIKARAYVNDVPSEVASVTITIAYSEMGFYTYRSRQIQTRYSPIAMTQFVGTYSSTNSAAQAANQEKARKIAQDQVFNYIKYKAITDLNLGGDARVDFATIRFIKIDALDKQVLLESKQDVDNFMTSISTALSTGSSNLNSIIANGTKVALDAYMPGLGTALFQAVGFVKDLFSWIFGSDRKYYVAHSAGYYAEYYISVNGIQIVGPGAKESCEAQLPGDTTDTGDAVYEKKWHLMSTQANPKDGVLQFTEEVIADRETPTYTWDLSAFSTAEEVVVEQVITNPPDVCSPADCTSTYTHTNTSIKGIRQLQDNNYEVQDFPYVYQLKPLAGSFDEDACFFATGVVNNLYNGKCKMRPTNEPYRSYHDFGDKIPEMIQKAKDGLPTNVVSSQLVYQNNVSFYHHVGYVDYWHTDWIGQNIHEFNPGWWIGADKQGSYTSWDEVRWMTGTIGFKYTYKAYVDTVEYALAKSDLINNHENGFTYNTTLSFYENAKDWITRRKIANPNNKYSNMNFLYTLGVGLGMETAVHYFDAQNQWRPLNGDTYLTQ